MASFFSMLSAIIAIFAGSVLLNLFAVKLVARNKAGRKFILLLPAAVLFLYYYAWRLFFPFFNKGWIYEAYLSALNTILMAVSFAINIFVSIRKTRKK